MSRQQRDLGPYCTTLCLKGLVDKGPLDPCCPNVHQHGEGHHTIDLAGFRQQIRKVLRCQLSYCEELLLYGAKGWLYRIRLPTWGYTVVAKGTKREYRSDLRREARIYGNYLKPVQGVHTPVYLGSFSLSKPLHYIGFVPIVHMMVLSFGGCSLNHLGRSLTMTEDIQAQAIQGLRAIHATGVLHGDIARRNLLWNSRMQCVVWHDFDAATTPRRSPLAERSGNENMTARNGKKSVSDPEREFSKEIWKARSVLGRGAGVRL